ncbi:hypothetical protein GCM10012284_46910 [Mangrovihabitans endophyticus]|uniref:Uncharacterized protein n=1 Tax=Mangrovihabitans endophyticus TaxID=1751298 RepID=A0A8J3FQ62_9ACTN|nr:hypothetical protein GCM10012284_46910 [Mangrovihabitans endophyticus]
MTGNDTWLGTRATVAGCNLPVTNARRGLDPEFDNGNTRDAMWRTPREAEYCDPWRGSAGPPWQWAHMQKLEEIVVRQLLCDR